MYLYSTWQQNSKCLIQKLPGDLSPFQTIYASNITRNDNPVIKRKYQSTETNPEMTLVAEL